jgi:antitoxin component YwqK of YwqJK toxin-antitoxin module
MKIVFLMLLVLVGCSSEPVEKKFEERDGVLYELNVQKGPYNGKIISTFPNGQIKWEENYVDGKLHGEYAEFREDGTKKFEATYEHGFYVDGGEL